VRTVDLILNKKVLKVQNIGDWLLLILGITIDEIDSVHINHNL